MSKPILTVHGTGRHGAVVVDTALELGWEVKRTDDSEGTAPEPGDPCIIGIGDNAARKNCSTDGLRLTSIVHQSAAVSPAAYLAPGVFVGRGAMVNNAARVGRGSIINTSAIVEHDCRVGEYCHVSPGAILCGTVTLGEGVWVGAGARVINNATIAPWTVIGMGANVVKDITEPGTYIGNPARKLE